MNEITVIEALDKISGAIKEYIDNKSAQNEVTKDDVAQATDEEVINMLTEVLDNNE